MSKRYAVFVSKCKEHLGGVCIDCGTIDDLEISHNDPAVKSFDILNQWSRVNKNWDALVLPELDKCSLRCHRCHLIYDEKRPDPLHGTHNMYLTYKCRCDLCREAEAEYNRKRLGWNKRAPPIHGTRTMYEAYKCRCDSCKEAMKEYWNKYYRECRAV